MEVATTAVDPQHQLGDEEDDAVLDAATAREERWIRLYRAEAGSGPEAAPAGR